MKTKTVLWTLLASCIMLLVQGCTVQKNQQRTIQEKKETEEIRTYEPEQPDEIQTTEETTQTETEEPQKLREVSELYYAYHCLDREKQQIYLEMLDALTGIESGVRLSTVDKSMLDVVFACVMNDHPELFYVEGYQFTEYMMDTVVTEITFSGTYSMTADEIGQAQLSIVQRLRDCFAQIPLNEDEYNTVKYLYEWLINNTEYDKTVENNQNICSVFLQGKSVCQGYAKAMQYMLQQAGIQCLLVTGLTNGERHGWNLVRVNGNYYYLDPTWGDASYTSIGTDSASQAYVPSINYDYFLVTTDEITRTHSIEKVVPLPVCSALADNYFVREGLYFDSYDEAKLTLIFDSDTVKSAGSVTLKCDKDETYASLIQNLITEQKIFDFVDKRGASIAYTFNETQRTISFWDL